MKFVLKSLLVSSTVMMTACWDSGNDYQVLQNFPSPQGNHTATLWEGMGGGAAGWCSQRINVDRSVNPFNLETAKGKTDYVFQASCDSKISVRWLDERELEIGYTIDHTGVSVYQRPSSESDNDVKITYLAPTLNE